MTRAQRIAHKKGNQARRTRMLADKSGDGGVNAYSRLHFGFIQKGKHTPKPS